MDNKELLLIADAVSKEKNIPRMDVLTALAEGIEVSLRKNFPEQALVRVVIDETSGEVKAYRLFELVEQIEDVETQMLKNEVDDELVIDGFVYEPFSFNMNRQQYNITKQVALQKIKQLSRDNQIEELLEQPVALFSGTVKVAKKDQLIVDCQGLDITIYRRNLLPRDNYKVSDKIFFVLEKDKNQYVGTRISNTYLEEVLRKEVYYIEDGDIEVVAIARNPGVRSKVIVKSHVRGLDPVKACIGARGSVIKNIQSFLGGEYVDIIEDSDDKAQLLISAFAPVNVTKIVMDEDTHTMEIAVEDADISQAIGKGGKNIELISKLIGWNVNVLSSTEWSAKEENVMRQLITTFMRALSCDEEVAQLLVENGFSSVEEVAYLPRAEFDVEELDDETIDALRENARITTENKELLKSSVGAGELIGLGFDDNEVNVLQKNHVFGQQDVADLAVFELQDIFNQMDDVTAQKIIMLARKHDPRFQDNAAQTMSS